MSKLIMILGGSDIQVPIIKKNRELGNKTIVVDFNPKAPGFEFADKALIVSTNNEKEVLHNAINEKIDGILTTSDLPVRVVAYVAKRLKLKALSEESAFLTTNKFALRNKLKEGGLNVPEYHIFNNKTQLTALQNFPYVIKPVDSSGSRGVKKVNSVNELQNWLPKAIKFSNSGQVIIESFLEGKEYSVEAIVQNGKCHIIAITEKILLSNKSGYFVESAHIVPASINNNAKKIVISTVKDAIQILGIDDSACHAELKIENGKVTIVEIGARLGGDFIGSHLVHLATGIDMLKNITRLALGIPINTNPGINKYAAVQFLNTSNYYAAKNFIKKNQDLVLAYEIKPFKDVEIKNSFNRLGYFILCFDSRERLNTTLKKINR